MAAQQAFWSRVRNEKDVLPCNVPDGVRRLRKGYWDFRLSLLASLSQFSHDPSGCSDGKGSLSPLDLRVCCHVVGSWLRCVCCFWTIGGKAIIVRLVVIDTRIGHYTLGDEGGAFRGR